MIQFTHVSSSHLEGRNCLSKTPQAALFVSAFLSFCALSTTGASANPAPKAAHQPSKNVPRVVQNTPEQGPRTRALPPIPHVEIQVQWHDQPVEAAAASTPIRTEVSYAESPRLAQVQVGQSDVPQVDRHQAPAAPQENPPALTIPITPDKSQPAEPNTPAQPATPDAGATTSTTPGTTPGTTVGPGAEPFTPPPSFTNAEGSEIAEVRVVGNRVVPETSILAVLGTRRGAAFSSRQAEFDRAKISALGFFSGVEPQVSPNLEDPSKVNVVFAVQENRVVTAIAFAGNQLAPKEDLQKAVQSKVGSVLNFNTVNDDVARIQEVYRAKGFAVLVTGTPQNAEGVLTFQLQEGRISRIVIQGNKKTSEALIRKLIFTRPGVGFDQNKIRQDLNRIYDTGFFEDVSYKIDADEGNPGSYVVTIIVKERRTGQLSLGVGFDSRSKINGFGTIGENNFRGTGKHVSASVELGSQRSFNLGFGDPFVGPKNAAYDVSVFSSRFIREPRSVARITGTPTQTGTQTFSFEEQRTGGRFNFTIPRDQYRYANYLLGYRNERAKLFQTDNQGNQVPLKLDTSSSGTVSAFSLGFLRDRRDLRTDPSSGGREQIIIEKAVKLLGNQNFTKLDLDVRRYFPLIGAPSVNQQPKLVFAVRAVLGRSLGQLPAFEQYFIGGSDTVRGYNTEQQFGDNQFYSNFELRYRLKSSIQVVGFADVGEAMGGRFSSSTGGVLFGAGIGLRLRTPIGPVRLDLARGSEGIKTHFAIGPTF